MLFLYRILINIVLLFSPLIILIRLLKNTVCIYGQTNSKKEPEWVVVYPRRKPTVHSVCVHHVHCVCVHIHGTRTGSMFAILEDSAKMQEVERD